MNEAHDEHGHGHAHEHEQRWTEVELRVRTLESLLVEKGYVDPAALDELVETYAHRIGPQIGAKIVAKAWCDSAFREWLVRDATSAIASLGHTGRQSEHMVALENTAGVHNLVVCTLCSCYPWAVLGLPPVWYKSAPYRSRAVIDPRGVLRDFGVELPETTEVRVWDSTAEVRYLVVPPRPANTENWSEQELSKLVTRESMIGTGFARVPEGAGS
jgi:nitrile hydratase